MASEILSKMFEALFIILSSAINTTLKVVLVLFGATQSFHDSVPTFSVPELAFYSLLLFGFAFVIVKFVFGSLKGFFYFGLVLLILWVAAFVVL